jgi:hypothetical protein
MGNVVISMLYVNILQPFGRVYGYVVHFDVIWYNVSCFGVLHHIKSGSPVAVMDGHNGVLDSTPDIDRAIFALTWCTISAILEDEN